MKKRANSVQLMKRARGVQQAKQQSGASFSKTAADLAEIGRGFYARGWVLGTSGNFSAVVSREPLRLAITSTGLDKSNAGMPEIVEPDAPELFGNT